MRQDLGHGVSAELRAIDGEALGVAYWHPRPDGGGVCEGWMPFHGPDSWEVVSLEPLHLHPSILCRACGHHGWVRDGRWAPA